MVLMVLCVTVSIPLQIGFRRLRQASSMLALDWLTTSAFMLDVVVQFRTGYITRTGEVVRDSRLIAAQYVRGMFALDLVSALPYQAVFSVRAGQLVWLGLLKLPRLVRLSRSMSMRGHIRTTSMVAMVRLLVAMMVVIHGSVCVWHYLYEELPGWPWAFDSCDSCREDMTSYLFGFYQSFLLLLGDRPVAKNNVERVLLIFLLFLGAFFYASVVGMMTLMVSNLWAVGSRHKQRAAMVDDALRYRGVSREVRDKVGEYFDYLAQFQHPGSDGVAFLQELPVGLYGSVMASMFGPLLSQVQLFAHCERPFVWRLSQKLRLSLFMAGDVIYELGSVGHDMYIIWKGCVGLVAPGGCMAALLGDGQHFGELGLMAASMPRPHRAVALRPCDVVHLGRWDLQDAMRDFPASAELIKERARWRMEDHEAGSSNLWAATAGMLGLGADDGAAEGAWVSLARDDSGHDSGGSSASSTSSGSASSGSSNSGSPSSEPQHAAAAGEPLGGAGDGGWEDAAPAPGAANAGYPSESPKPEPKPELEGEREGEREQPRQVRAGGPAPRATASVMIGKQTLASASVEGGSGGAAAGLRGPGPVAEAHEVATVSGSGGVRPPSAALTGRLSGWFVRGLRSSIQQHQQQQNQRQQNQQHQQHWPQDTQHGRQQRLQPARTLTEPARAPAGLVHAQHSTQDTRQSPAAAGRSVPCQDALTELLPVQLGSQPAVSTVRLTTSAHEATADGTARPAATIAQRWPATILTSKGVGNLPRWMGGAGQAAAATAATAHPVSAAAPGRAAASASAQPRARALGAAAAAADGSAHAVPLAPDDRAWAELLRATRSSLSSNDPSNCTSATGSAQNREARGPSRGSLEQDSSARAGPSSTAVHRLNRQHQHHHQKQEQALRLLLGAGATAAASEAQELRVSGSSASATRAPAAAAEAEATTGGPDMRARALELLGPEVCRISDERLSCAGDAGAAPSATLTPRRVRHGGGKPRNASPALWIDTLLDELRAADPTISGNGGGQGLARGEPLQPGQPLSPRTPTRPGSQRGHARPSAQALGPQALNPPATQPTAEGEARAAVKAGPPAAAALPLKRGNTAEFVVVLDAAGAAMPEDLSVRSAMAAITPASPDTSSRPRYHRLRQSVMRAAPLTASGSPEAPRQPQPQPPRGAASRREAAADRDWSGRRSSDYGVVAWVREASAAAAAAVGAPAAATPVTGWRPAQGRVSATGAGQSRNSSRSGFKAASAAAPPDSQTAAAAKRYSTGGTAPGQAAARRRPPVRRNSTASLLARRSVGGHGGGGGGAGGAWVSEDGSELSDSWSDGSGKERHRERRAALQRRLAESQAALASVLADPLKVPSIAAIVRREVEAAAARLAARLDGALRGVLEEVTGVTARAEELWSQAGRLDERLQALEEAGSEGAGIGGDSVLGVQLKAPDPPGPPRNLSNSSSGGGGGEAAQLALRMLHVGAPLLARRQSSRRSSQVGPAAATQGILKHSTTGVSPPEVPSSTTTTTTITDGFDRHPELPASAWSPGPGPGPGHGSGSAKGRNTGAGLRVAGSGSGRRRSGVPQERLPLIAQAAGTGAGSAAVRAVVPPRRSYRSLELPSAVASALRQAHAAAALPATTANTPDASAHGGGAAGRRVHRLSSLGYALWHAAQAQGQARGSARGGGGADERGPDAAPHTHARKVATEPQVGGGWQRAGEAEAGPWLRNLKGPTALGAEAGAVGPAAGEASAGEASRALGGGASRSGAGSGAPQEPAVSGAPGA